MSGIFGEPEMEQGGFDVPVDSLREGRACEGGFSDLTRAHDDDGGELACEELQGAFGQAGPVHFFI